MRLRSVVGLVVLLSVVTACAPPAGEASDDPVVGDAAGVTVVDSIVPMEAALEAFRQGMPKPRGLVGGESSRDALIERFVQLLAANDTAGFERIAIDRAEYAWLYFPTAPEAKPPYELPPELSWFRVQQINRVGVFRALGALGGRGLELESYRCDPEPTIEGENRLWTGCVVTFGGEGNEEVSLEVFGAIVERGGRFKFLSYSNAF